MAAKISIYILTYNEEKNIRDCLESILQLSDDIHIIDSYSNDNTLKICREYDVNIHQRKFDTFARQCNWALDDVQFRHDWIMRLDADERVPRALAEELELFLKQPDSNVTGIMLKKRMYFMGRWIKHGRMYPMLRLAVYKKGTGYYEDKEEEQFILTEGRNIIAKNDFYEFNLNNDLPFFMNKHLEYAEDEFREFLDSNLDSDVKPKLTGNKIERTRWLKIYIYNRVPLFIRPIAYFLYRYFICLGFLDGKPGLIFHTLQAFWYRFYVDSRIYEERSRWFRQANDYDDLK